MLSVSKLAWKAQVRAMPIFGNPDDFGLECEFSSRSGKWCFGSLRLWLSGRSVGDFEDAVDLASSARWAETFVRESPRRTRGDLDEQKPATVYDELYGRAMRDVSHAIGAPFLLDDVGEASWRDRETVLAVRRADGRDRVIVHDHRAGDFSDYIVSEGAVDRVLKHYADWAAGLGQDRDLGDRDAPADAGVWASLRVTDGWRVAFSDCSDTMSIDDLKEDLMRLEQKDLDLVLDVGWYPEFDPHGCFVLFLYQGDFHEGVCLAEFRTKKQVEVVYEIERLLVAAAQRA